MVNRVDLNLRSSLCTDTPAGTPIYDFRDPEAECEQNTGIERGGGVTNLYQQQTAHATAGTSVVTRSGDLLQVDSSHNVRINDTVVGNVGPYAMTLRGMLAGYADAAWSATGTIIAIVRVGDAIRVDEITASTGAVANTRTTTFSMPAVVITSLCLIKYPSMAFADDLEYIASNNTAAYLIKESDGSVTTIGGTVWATQTLAGNTWKSVAWAPTLGLFVAVGAGGTNYAASSTDGASWTTRTITAGAWNAVAWSPQLAMFVAVGNGDPTNAASSTNGTSWTNRTLADATWDTVCWSPELAVFVALGGNNYAISSNGTSWTVAGMAAGYWHSVCWSPSLRLFVAVGDGSIGGSGPYAVSSTNGTSWSARTLAAGTWESVCWSEEKQIFVAVASDGTDRVATSTNGTSWTVGTISADAWKSVSWSPQLSLFVAVGGGTTNYTATSPDGVTWSYGTLEANTWNAVCWSPELAKFVAVGEGGTSYAATYGASAYYGITFGWKFYADNYLLGDQGRSGSWSIGDPTGTPTAITDCTWAAMDTFCGTAYSRAVITFDVKKNAANLLTGIGEVGYNQAGTYSATPTYYGVALAAVTVTITNNVSGPGYAEATFTRSDTATNIYYYQAPVMGHTGGGPWYDYQQSQTHTLCNGYGKLTDIPNNSLGPTCSLRAVMIPTSGGVSGRASLLSAAVVGASSTSPIDCLGVPVTQVGEFDEFFVPHIVDNGTTKLQCVYRYNGTLFHLTIEKNATHTIQRVGDNVYMVNCLSPINAVDVAEKTMTLGVNDYNGRMLLRSSGAIGAAAQVVGLMQGGHANSIDTGDKSSTQTFSTVTNIIPGIELPSFVDRTVKDYGANIYLADTYSTTYKSYNAARANVDLEDVLYVTDTRIPFAIGYPFSTAVMKTDLNTVFVGVGVTGSSDINFDYLCYELGNDIPGQFESFRLFGQTYVCDENDIYLTTFNGSLYSGKGAPLAQCTGMVYVASSPTNIFFLSAFDNSIYVFNGGRELSKLTRMNDLEVITDGVWSVRDNTLCLQTANTIIWVRDEVVSLNNKLALQTSTRLYDTVNGVVVLNDTYKWVYSYVALSASTVVALTWQSPYYGPKGATRAVTTDWFLTLYCATRTAPVSVTVTCDSFDEDGYASNVKTVTLNPADWTSMGYTRIRMQPKTQRALGSSITVTTTSKLVITEVSVQWGDEAVATPRAARSL
jgi:hypothetical protein